MAKRKQTTSNSSNSENSDQERSPAPRRLRHGEMPAPLPPAMPKVIQWTKRNSTEKRKPVGAWVRVGSRLVSFSWPCTAQRRHQKVSIEVRQELNPKTQEKIYVKDKEHAYSQQAKTTRKTLTYVSLIGSEKDHFYLKNDRFKDGIRTITFSIKGTKHPDADPESANPKWVTAACYLATLRTEDVYADIEFHISTHRNERQVHQFEFVEEAPVSLSPSPSPSPPPHVITPTITTAESTSSSSTTSSSSSTFASPTSSPTSSPKRTRKESTGSNTGPTSSNGSKRQKTSTGLSPRAKRQRNNLPQIKQEDDITTRLYKPLTQPTYEEHFEHAISTYNGYLHITSPDSGSPSPPAPVPDPCLGLEFAQYENDELPNWITSLNFPDCCFAKQSGLPLLLSNPRLVAHCAEDFFSCISN